MRFAGKRISECMAVGGCVALFAVVACAPSTELAEPGRGEQAEPVGPHVTEAIFDLPGGDLPEPNDLRLDRGGVVPRAAPALSQVDQLHRSSAAGLRGFSAAQAAHLRFSGDVDGSSLNDSTVRVIDLDAPGEPAVTVEYRSCNRSLRIMPTPRWQHGHRYLVAVSGGSSGVRDVAGRPVEPSSDFRDRREGRVIDPSFEPLFDLASAHGLARDALVALWAFTVTRAAEAVVDLSSRSLPFPNDLLRNQQSGLVSLPLTPGDVVPRNMVQAFNELDGFSLTGALTVDFTRPVDGRQLRAGTTVRLFELNGSSSRSELVDLRATVSDDGLRLRVQPARPLEPAKSYALIVTDLRDTQGARVAPMDDQLWLVHPQRLVSAGASLSSELCDDEAQQRESARAVLAPLASSLRLPPSSVNAAFVFTTQDILARLRALWEAPYRHALPLELTELDAGSPFAQGLGLLAPDISKVIYGKLVTIDFLDASTRAFGAAGTAVPRKIPFVLALPKSAKAGDRVPVVVFGHGLFTERRLALAAANRLARSGMLTSCGVKKLPYLVGQLRICWKSTSTPWTCVDQFWLPAITCPRELTPAETY